MVLRTASFLAALVAGARWVPSETWDRLFYDVASLGRLWPAVVLGAFAWLLHRGDRAHKQSGLPILAPYSAAALISATVAGGLVLITTTSADWSTVTSAAACACFAIIATQAVVALERHAELWRRGRSNDSVIDAVVDSVNRGWTSRSDDEWGSPHRLRIVEGHYQNTKRAYLFPHSGSGTPRDLERCVRAGEELVRYLGRRWPASDAAADARAARRSAVVRELATLTLLAPARQQAQHEARIALWRSAIGAGGAADHALVNHALGLGRYPPAPLELAQVRAEVATALRLFGDIEEHSSRVVARDTWVALAHHSLPPAACFDVWLAMNPVPTADPLALPDREGDCDPARVGARRFLSSHYARWAGAVGGADGWADGLRGRGRYAGGATARDDAESRATLVADWAAVPADTRRRSSWTYPEVFEADRVRIVAATLVTTLFVGAMATLVLVNPRLSDPFEWNTVDHVEDMRFLHDYTDAEVTALAGSGGYLAVGTRDAGLVVMNKSTRTMQSGVRSGTVLDVSGGPGDGSFTVLGEDQQLSLVATSGLAGASAATLAPRPAEPVWHAKPFGLEAVVATALDQRGWLLAVKGVGVARYDFRQRDGREVRTRSWQQGPLSNIPLDQAVITTAGVWITLTGGGIRFAKLQTLGESTDREVKTPPIVRFEADSAGRWASATDESGSLWLYSSGGGWSGPWLGGVGAGAGLTSAASVTLTRVDGDTAWLGTAGGLYAYDVKRRRMHDVIAGAPIESLELVDGALLAAGPRGLYRATGVDEAGVRRYQSERIDDGAVRSLSVAADGRLAAYTVRPGGQSTDALRAVASPFAAGNRTDIASGQEWKALSSPPELVGVVPVSGGALFATTAGCFVYGVAGSTYKNCAFTPSRNVGAFTAIARGDTATVGVADGVPVVLDRANPASGAWSALENSPVGKPRQITETGSKVVTVDDTNELDVYDTTASTPVTYGRGRAASVSNPPTSTFPGDLATGAGTWRAAFLNGDRLVTYDSQAGQLREQAVPARVGGVGAIAQVKWLGARVVFVLFNGSIVGADDGSQLFPGSGLPFGPDRVTAVAQGQNDTVLVGAADGRVYRYAWRSASWSSVGTLAGTGTGAVIELAEVAGTVKARVSGDDGTFTLNSGRWTRATDAAVVKYDASPDVKSGPWRWSLTAGALRVVKDGDGQVRGWRPIGTAFGFADDSVDRIVVGADGAARIRTPAGLFAYDVAGGRGDAQPESTIQPERATAANAAVTVGYNGGHVTFAAVDGGAPFQAGRLFSDEIDSVVGIQGTLYTLLPGRGVAARTVAAPGAVTNFWPLPPLPADARPILDRDGNALWLRTGGAQPATYSLAVANGAGAGWQPVSGERVEVTTGLIEWRSGAGGSDEPKPWLKPPQGPAQPVEPWWAGGSFAWDRVSGSGAGTGGIALQITPAGMFARRANGRDVTTIDFWPATGLESLGSARDGAKIRGPLVRENDGTVTLVSADGPAPAVIRRSPGDPAQLQRARMTIGLGEQAGQGVSLTVTEDWTPAGAGEALRSALPAIPTEQLVKAGRFIFDRASAAGPEAVGGSRWLTLVDCPPPPSDSCLLGANEALGDKLLFRDLPPARTPIAAFGSQPDGTLLGLAPASPDATGPLVVRAALRDPSGPRWSEPMAATSAADAFRRGDRVQFDVSGLTLTAQPRLAGRGGAAVSATLPRADPFVAQGDGVAFGFDVFTSVSVDRAGSELAVGTRRGIDLCALGEGETPDMVTRASDGVLRLGCRQRVTTDDGPDVSRLRRDGDGRLWAKVGASQVTELEPAGKLEPKVSGWPGETATVHGDTLDISSVGFRLGTKEHVRSNDAWGLGRASLAGIVDFVVDGDTLWLATKDAGVFKVLPDRLH